MMLIVIRANDEKKITVSENQFKKTVKLVWNSETVLEIIHNTTGKIESLRKKKTNVNSSF